MSNQPVVADGAPSAFRMNRRSEQVISNVFNGLQQAAVEGSFFTWAAEGTRNTGINIGQVVGTYANTAAVLVIVNRNPVGGPTLYLDSAKIAYDAVNTNGVAGFIYHGIENAERYSSGGTVANGYNAYGQNPPGIYVYCGAVTCTAPGGSARDIDKTVYINGVGPGTPIMNLRMVYSCQEKPTASITLPATAGVDATYYVNPVVLPPGSSYVANEFQTSRTVVGTGEFFVSGILR